MRLRRLIGWMLFWIHQQWILLTHRSGCRESMDLKFYVDF